MLKLVTRKEKRICKLIIVFYKLVLAPEIFLLNDLVLPLQNVIQLAEPQFQLPGFRELAVRCYYYYFQNNGFLLFFYFWYLIINFYKDFLLF